MPKENKSATAPQGAAPATPIVSPVYVAGHGSFTDDKGRVNVYVIVKDKVAKDLRFKLQGENKASKTGTIWASAGISLDEMKEQCPVGEELAGFAWGEERETDFGGVFNVIEA